MPDTEIRDLKTEATEIVACPVLIEGEDGPENCGWRLVTIVTKTIRGDDYGSWAEYSVSFACGHSFDDMRKSLRYEGVI